MTRRSLGLELPRTITNLKEILVRRIIYKILLVLAAVFALIVAVLTGLGTHFAVRLRSSGLAERSVKARLILKVLDQRNAKIGILVGNQEMLEKVAAAVREDPDILYIIFYNKNGDVIYDRYVADYDSIDFVFPGLPSGETARLTQIVSIHGTPAVDAALAVRLPPAWVAAEAGGPAGKETKEVIGWVRIGLSATDVFQTVRQLRNLAALVLALLVVLGVALALALHRTIARPIIRIAAAAGEISKGNLSVRLPVSGADEIGRLAVVFNDLLHHTAEQIAHTSLLVDNLSETVDLVTQTTNEIYSISAQQSSGATEQAASVYQASSTSKEIAASAIRIAETAEIVLENARRTSEASEEGRVELGNAIAQVKDVSEKVVNVTERIVELGSKSQKISGIIAIINEISEQTNLLALNAAIEAAGAGETGKRFAVVAQEIRRLAGRTLEATQVVKQLIEEIQSATNSTVMVTEQSMKSAKDAAETIERMNQSFQNILELVERTLSAGTEITLSTRQQTTACEQMVTTVMEVSEVAAEVEKGAKETELALVKLRDLAAHLKELIAARLPHV